MTFLTWVPTTTICGSWIISAPTVLKTSWSLFITGMRASISSDTDPDLSIDFFTLPHTDTKSFNVPQLKLPTGVSLDLLTTAHTVAQRCIMGVWVKETPAQTCCCQDLSFAKLHFLWMTLCSCWANKKKDNYFSPYATVTKVSTKIFIVCETNEWIHRCVMKSVWSLIYRLDLACGNFTDEVLVAKRFSQPKV